VRGKVEIGQRRDGKAEIVSGIAADELIVTAGQLKLRDGVPVQVAGGSTAVTAAPTAPGATGIAPVSAPAKVETAVTAPPKS
jgi:membrane fusion protein, multidrug efflux system